MSKKQIIFVAILSAILIAYASKKIADARRSAFAKRAYKDKNIATAQTLYNALYPDGKPRAKFSMFNPFSVLGVAKDQFKANADVERVMQIARDDIDNANFKKIAKAYKILYRSDLLFDLQNELDKNYDRFKSILRGKQDRSDKPQQNEARLKALAKSIYNDVYAWGRADDDLYEELYDLSDDDFIFVYDEFRIIADEKGTKDSLAQEIADDSWSIDLSDKLAKRFRKLGLT